MRRRVSGATPTVKVLGVKEVTVRQVPFMEIESPRLQSVRMGAALEIVRVVPPVGSEVVMSETADSCEVG